MRKLLFHIVVLCCLSVQLRAQDGAGIAGRKDVLTLDDFSFLLHNYHPVARQAALLARSGQFNMRTARGYFDPFAYTYYYRKVFAEKLYFDLVHAEIGIPTWFGLTVWAIYNNNDGVFLNPQNFTPDGGFFRFGGTVNVSRYLFFDERRMAFRQAQLFRKSSEVQRIGMLNDLYYEAFQQYWKWVMSYQQLQVYEDFVENANVRFNAVKGSYEQGLVPAIDTLEALIQYQNRQLSRNDALMSYRKQTFGLSNFLWYEQNIPLRINEHIHPPDTMMFVQQSDLNLDSLRQLIEALPYAHPELVNYSYKLDSLDYYRRYKQEMLKPKLEVTYEVIVQPVSESLRMTDNLVDFDNYYFNVIFRYPLFLRRARGELQQTKVKIDQTRFKFDLKRRELINKLQTIYNQLLILEQQVELYSKTVSNYQRLLWAEVRKFGIGESSLFLINQREQKLIDARLKLIELQVKYQIAQAGVRWASGNLSSHYDIPLFD